MPRALLKLARADLGLIKSLVRPRASETQAGADDTYKMTGGTGSLRYLAPENFLGKPYNEKTDIYSFSIIVWELLARTPLLFMRSKRVGHARVECALFSPAFRNFAQR